MFYFLPLFMLAAFAGLNGLAACSPLIFSLWLTSLTGTLAFFLLSESSLSGGTLLYLVEESLSCWILLIWLLWGGGMGVSFFLFMKMAFAPFHKWLVEVLNETESGVFVWSMTVHKLPATLLLGSMVSYWSAVFLFSSFLWGVLSMLKLGETRSLLILSSSNTLVFVVLLLVKSLILAFLFFLLYIMMFWSSWILGKQSINSALILFGAGGIPPFLLFQSKWMVFSFFFQQGEALPLLLAIFSGAASMVYIRFIMFFDYIISSWSEVAFFTFWMVVSLLVPTC